MTANMQYIGFSHCLERTTQRFWKTWKTQGISFCQICRHPVKVPKLGQLTYVPPVFVFQRKRMKMELMDGAPTGSTFGCQKNGWMIEELFLKWMQHFIDSTKPSKDKPILLVLDGHSTHTKTVAALELASSAGVIMLSVPPHCTHRLQPLDVGFFQTCTMTRRFKNGSEVILSPNDTMHSLSTQTGCD